MKNKVINLIIDIYLGWTGYHLFRERRTGAALLWLFTLGYCGIGWFYRIGKDIYDMVKKDAPKENAIYFGDVENELQKIDAMEGHDFEYYCAELLRRNGYINVSVTQGSGDYGIDILASKDDVTYSIQCKCYSNPVGNKAVQEAYSGQSYYNTMVSTVLTNSTFTRAAVETAERNRVMLWDRSYLASLISNAAMQGG